MLFLLRVKSDKITQQTMKEIVEQLKLILTNYILISVY